MATSNNDAAMENTDPNMDPKRRESKKKKFKPLSGLRKLFAGGKSKRKGRGEDENDGTPSDRSRPLSAPVLPSLEDERYVERRPLGDNRSMSEDSIFSPEQVALRQEQTTTSSRPQSAFQTELATKLNKRRSQNLEGDNSDGKQGEGDIVRESAKPLGASLETQGVPSDHSDATPAIMITEEDDPFQSRWMSAVPSSHTSSKSSLSDETDRSLDLSKMAQTELLKSDIAKDRISVKPRSRKTAWHSRKNREGRYSMSLPSLVEAVPSGGQSTSAAAVPTRPRSEYIDPAILSDFDLHAGQSSLSSVELRGPGRQGTRLAAVGASQDTGVHPSSTTTITSPPILGSSGKQGILLQDSGPNSPPPSKSAKTSKVSFEVDVKSTSSSHTEIEKTTGPGVLLSSENSKIMLVKIPTQAEVGSASSSSNGGAKTSAVVTSATPSIKVQPTQAEGLRQTDSQAADAFSPKPDYKIRRQNRSKTLPVEHLAITVQRAAAQREESKYDVSPTQGRKLRENETREEPEWFALARRKSQKHNDNNTQSMTSGTDSASVNESSAKTKSGVNITATSNITTTTKTQVLTPEPTKLIIVSPSSGQSGKLTNNNSTEKEVTVTTSTQNKNINIETTVTKSQQISIHSTHSVVSSASSSSTSISRQEKKEQPISSNTSSMNDVLKWKTQSTKTVPTFLSKTTPVAPTSSGSVHTRSLSVKGPSQQSQLSSSTKTDSGPKMNRSNSQEKSDAPVLRPKKSSDIKIELIETTPTNTMSRTNKKTTDSTLHQDSVTKTSGDVKDSQSDQCRTSVSTKRQSRVMDLMKNFENVQIAT